MGLKVGILSSVAQHTLGAYLTHIDCDVDSFKNTESFLTYSTKVDYKVIFIEDGFFKTEDDFFLVRRFLNSKTQRKKDSVRVFFLNNKLNKYKLPHSGSVSPDDLNAVKKLVEESISLLMPANDLGLEVMDYQSEEIIEIEEELEDTQEGKILDAIAKIEKSQSIDELGVNYVSALENLVAGRKGVFFKYLPNYCSLVALAGFNFDHKKNNGIGLNFSNSNGFKPGIHLQRLAEIPAFKKIAQKVFSHTNLKIKLVEAEGEVKGVLVYENLKSSSATEDVIHILHKYVNIKLASMLNKEKYLKNKINDELTGCMLKDQFFDQVQNEVIRARRVLLPVSVMVLEIDGYFGIKAKYNQERINMLVRGFAKILKSNIRHNDLIGRLAESRFGIIFPHMSDKDSFIKARSIQEIFKQTYFFNDLKKKLVCSASIAIGTYPNHIASADELVLGLEGKLTHKEHMGRIVQLKEKEDFVKDFEERSLQPAK